MSFMSVVNQYLQNLDRFTELLLVNGMLWGIVGILALSVARSLIPAKG